MQMQVSPASADCYLLTSSLCCFQVPSVRRYAKSPSTSISIFSAESRIWSPIPSIISSVFASSSLFKYNFSDADPHPSLDDDKDDDDNDAFGSSFPVTKSQSISNSSGDGIEIEIEKIGKNRRRIQSKIEVGTNLQTVWDILTDYETLADFIPSLAVSQLLEKRDKFARLFQIGQQDFAFGLKFNAKGVIDCYEKDLESLPFGQRRDIEFKMIEGDFHSFEGKWSIKQVNGGQGEQSDNLAGPEFLTTVSYIVDVEPKFYLPVRLLEGRLCREIRSNLSSIREQALKAVRNNPPAH